MIPVFSARLIAERSSIAEKLQRGLLENEEVTIQMEDPAQKFQGAEINKI